MCLNGTFAHHTVVPEANVVKIPKDIPFEVACLFGCAVSRAGVRRCTRPRYAPAITWR